MAVRNGGRPSYRRAEGRGGHRDARVAARAGEALGEHERAAARDRGEEEQQRGLYGFSIYTGAVIMAGVRKTNSAAYTESPYILERL